MIAQMKSCNLGETLHCTHMCLPRVHFLWIQPAEVLGSTLALYSTAYTGTTWNVHGGMKKCCCACIPTVEPCAEMWVKAA